MNELKKWWLCRTCRMVSPMTEDNGDKEVTCYHLKPIDGHHQGWLLSRRMIPLVELPRSFDEA
jgi:hypothetical protein